MDKKVKQFSPQSLHRSPRLSEQVEAQLRESIYKYVYQQGEYLPSENELASIFGVSRSVIREALSMLSSKGLIKIEKGKGAFVLEPSVNNVLDSFSQLVNFKCGNKSLNNILEIRNIIEPSVAALAAQNRTEADIQKLQDDLEKMEKDQSDIVKLSHWDLKFHLAIASSCGNPVMPIVLEPLFHILSKYHPPIFYDEQVINITIQYHKKILQAIIAQIKRDAFVAMENHLKVTAMHNTRLYSQIENETLTKDKKILGGDVF